MNKKLRKTIRLTAISFGALLAVFLLAVAIVVNFIFTPEKLTPVVLNVANRTLNAHLQMEKVELTFFSTFPRFGLKVTDGVLVSKAINDTLWQKTDSLLSFKKCVVVVNPVDYLWKHKISLRYLGLEDATVYAFTNKEGKSNWDIVKSTSDQLEEDTVSQRDTTIQEIDINRVSLKRSNVTFDDRNTRVYTRVQNLNLTLKASLKKDYSALTLNYDNENLLFWQDGQLLVNHLAVGLNANMQLDRTSRKLTFKDTGLTLNGVALDLSGTLGRDSVGGPARVDLGYKLHAPSLETVLNMVPESVLKRQKLTANGEVILEGTLKGLYGKEYMPEATLKVNINKASAQYAGLPYGVDELTAEFNGYVDLMRQKPSYAHLKIFQFKGAHTDILADGKVEDLLGDPDITFHTRSEIDLTALAKTFPLQEGVSIGGRVGADFRLRCRLSSIQKQDWGRVRLKGKLDMQDMYVRDTTKNFEFSSNADLRFIGEDNLAAKVTIQKAVLRASSLSAELDELNATVKSTNPQDTTRLIDVECKLQMSRLKGGMGDSLKVFTKKAKASLHLQPGKRNPAMPNVKVALETDTLFCRMGQMKMGMDKGGFNLTAEKIRDSLWLPKGIIGFNRLTLRTPELALPIRMRKTAVTVGDRNITLRNASLRIGRSNLTASGAVYGLYAAMKKGKLLKANLEISSRNLDCNQLINALNFPQDTLQAETDTVSSSEPLQLFVIPPKIDFELKTNLNKVTYGNMVFEHVKGEVDIRNQAVYLKKLTMRGLEADVETTLVYRARKKTRGYAGFDFRLRQVNIGKLVDFIPSLDTIVPMLRSFKGMVDFDAAAEAVLDSNLNVKIPTLKAAIHIKGDSLVLMDGETFAEISKTLMFKNKKRNVFDSISVNLTVKDGNVTVYPFLLQIDRYKAAVGGTQGLDMNFNYHISVLKSPLPFKAGVNITGNLDKMKIRIGKAKYKDAVTPVAIRKVDSTRVNMGQEIIHSFERVMNRAYRGRLPNGAE
ncbi:AsmA family protein [Bacteroides mediterraneensis]|uniref:AsmA family protein n=1 Tax=Bacteroides mediterraneensis TaxID=1841856 RepID=UPI0009328424|nr:AsmA-like C-terminal region-containing protein [Bacteroides mediterraneensis]